VAYNLLLILLLASLFLCILFVIKDAKRVNLTTLILGRNMCHKVLLLELLQGLVVQIQVQVSRQIQLLKFRR